MAADAEEALEALVRSGVDRVLTSGQQPSALEGLEMLKRLHDRAAGRIVIMGCGALTPESIGAVCRALPLAEYHFSAPKDEPSRMRFRNTRLRMGGLAPEREYRHTLTDSERVRRTIAAARGALEA
jgi:copper homeostasis protein